MFESENVTLMTYTTAAETAAAAADFLAKHFQRVLLEKQRLAVALSGGRTPWMMLDELAMKPCEWGRIDVLQVDERVVPRDDVRLNATFINKHWVEKVSGLCFYPMPVQLPVADAITAYTQVLKERCEPAGILDVACLGLGADAHTASLIPGDVLVANTSEWLGHTVLYQDTHRVTMLRSLLDAARLKVWLVTGSDKAQALRHLMEADPRVPAGLIKGPSVIFADHAATGKS